MAASSPVAACRTHPANPAGWTCEACTSSLCPECVAEKRYGATSVVACTRCGGHAVVLKVPRARRSYASRLVSSMRLLARPFSLLTLVVLALFDLLMDSVGGYTGVVLWVLASWGWFIHVFFAAADGRRVEVPDFASIWDLLRPPLRAVASTAWVWGPAVLYVGFIRSADSPRPLFSQPFPWVFLGGGLFYGPIALMAAATRMPFLRMINPAVLLRSVFRLGFDYLVTLVAVGVCVSIGFGLGQLGGLIREAQLPGVSAFVPRMLSLIMPTLVAHVMGLLLYVRGNTLAYGHESDYFEPALPGIAPRGRLLSKPGEPGTPDRLEPTT